MKNLYKLPRNSIDCTESLGAYEVVKAAARKLVTI